MGGDAVQLGLPLPPAAPYALENFIPHSGAVEALRTIENGLHGINAAACAFSLVYLFGPPGCGKTHLARGAERAAGHLGFSEKIALFELETPLEEGLFIAQYERLRAEGGLLIAASPVEAGKSTSSPHLLSRFLSGSIVEMRYPREEELEPLIIALAARSNLKLSPRSIEYLLRRLPADPLSFTNIFNRINELALEQSRNAGFAVVRQAVEAKEP